MCIIINYNACNQNDLVTRQLCVRIKWKKKKKKIQGKCVEVQVRLLASGLFAVKGRGQADMHMIKSDVF